MKQPAFLMLACALVAIPLAGQEKSPAIAFSEHAKDFGKVTAGQTLTHVFRFTNKGQGVLEIFQVRPT